MKSKTKKAKTSYSSTAGGGINAKENIQHGGGGVGPASPLSGGDRARGPGVASPSWMEYYLLGNPDGADVNTESGGGGGGGAGASGGGGGGGGGSSSGSGQAMAGTETTNFHDNRDHQQTLFRKWKYLPAKDTTYDAGHRAKRQQVRDAAQAATGQFSMVLSDTTPAQATATASATTPSYAQESQQERQWQQQQYPCLSRVDSNASNARGCEFLRTSKSFLFPNGGRGDNGNGGSQYDGGGGGGGNGGAAVGASQTGAEMFRDMLGAGTASSHGSSNNIGYLATDGSFFPLAPLAAAAAAAVAVAPPALSGGGRERSRVAAEPARMAERDLFEDLLRSDERLGLAGWMPPKGFHLTSDSALSRLAGIPLHHILWRTP